MGAGTIGPSPNASLIATLNSRIFRRIDTNHDGQVSRQEMAQSGVLEKIGVARTPKDEDKIFDGADTNHDGYLSRGEAMQYFSNVFIGSPTALAAATMLYMDDSQQDETPEQLGSELDDTKHKPKKLDPNSEDAKRLANKVNRSSAAYSQALEQSVIEKITTKGEAMTQTASAAVKTSVSIKV